MSGKNRGRGRGRIATRHNQPESDNQSFYLEEEEEEKDIDETKREVEKERDEEKKKKEKEKKKRDEEKKKKDDEKKKKDVEKKKKDDEKKKRDEEKKKKDDEKKKRDEEKKKKEKERKKRDEEQEEEEQEEEEQEEEQKEEQKEEQEEQKEEQEEQKEEQEEQEEQKEEQEEQIKEKDDDGSIIQLFTNNESYLQNLNTCISISSSDFLFTKFSQKKDLESFKINLDETNKGNIKLLIGSLCANLNIRSYHITNFSQVENRFNQKDCKLFELFYSNKGIKITKNIIKIEKNKNAKNLPANVDYYQIVWAIGTIGESKEFIVKMPNSPKYIDKNHNELNPLKIEFEAVLLAYKAMY